jgi:3-hydroxyacyl-[acyl-carrier-protein] dehydratase
MIGKEPGTTRLPATVDRLLRLEPGVEAVAVRNVPATLSIFDSHFPRLPVLPGVLLLESMAATAGLMLREPGERWRLAGAEVVRFRHFVRPGDQAVIAASLRQRTDDWADCTVTVSVDGRTVATARRLRLARVNTAATAPATAPATRSVGTPLAVLATTPGAPA